MTGIRASAEEHVFRLSHFTGKERDAESGNDYFEARYYSSAMGRFMSPDWSAKLEPVPYAKLDNPQSLNLYSYVLNNPLSAADPDGHETPEEVAKKNVDNANISKGTDRYDVNATVVSNCPSPKLHPGTKRTRFLSSRAAPKLIFWCLRECPVTRHGNRGSIARSAGVRRRHFTHLFS